MADPAVILRQLATDAAPDADLLRRFATTRDGVAFAELVRRHGPVVLATCRRGVRNHHDADDAFQAVFLVLAREAGGIQRPELLGNWLYKVAVGVGRNARRAAARRRVHEVQGVDVPDPVAPPDNPSPDLGPVLDEELAALPAIYRDAVALCDLRGTSRADAAAALGIPLGTLASRLDGARKKLAARLVRRGVTFSVGAVLVEARAVAVPEGLVTKACEVVAVWSGGGVVSQSVLKLVQGGSSMRTVVLGGVLAVSLTAGAAVAAVLGGQPPPPPDPDRPGPAPTRAADPWVRRLPSGVTVTLVGVAEHPSKGKTWWGPDGAALATAPYDVLATELGGNGVTREFAVRVEGTPAGTEYQWEFNPAGSYAAGVPQRSGKDVPGLAAAVARFPVRQGAEAVRVGPVGQRSATVRAGVAAGGWQTDATHTAVGGGVYAAADRGVVFGRQHAAGAGTAVAVAHDIRGRAVRVTAVDTDGKEHPAGVSSRGTGHLTLLDAEFDLPLGRIREYRLQSKAYEWAEFRDVRLQPGTPAGPRP